MQSKIKSAAFGNKMCATKRFAKTSGTKITSIIAL